MFVSIQNASYRATIAISKPIAADSPPIKVKSAPLGVLSANHLASPKAASQKLMAGYQQVRH